MPRPQEGNLAGAACLHGRPRGIHGAANAGLRPCRPEPLILLVVGFGAFQAAFPLVGGLRGQLTSWAGHSGLPSRQPTDELSKPRPPHGQVTHMRLPRPVCVCADEVIGLSAIQPPSATGLSAPAPEGTSPGEPRGSVLRGPAFWWRHRETQTTSLTPQHPASSRHPVSGSCLAPVPRCLVPGVPMRQTLILFAFSFLQGGHPLSSAGVGPSRSCTGLDCV